MTIADGGAAFDAVVLAGGAASRLGGADKAEVVVGGRALLDHALAAVAGAARVVVVGPPALARPGVTTVLEDPPGGGPVAGLAAGLAALGPGADVVVVLACDVPGANVLVPALLDAAGEADGARVVDEDGRPQHLLAAYRRAALDTALVGLDDPHGAAVRRLVEKLRLVDVPDPGGLSADADTWADVDALDARLRGTIEP
ncbi:molybdenum cofactor guanylyltransferase [Cellulomonas sp. JH27-2]|uniref:molybdenum cofactor guanylyltransferase n=1 Tax=Cellulomonas sp. JH27-2 TaxID=2774139 RepID=UPI00351B8CDB